MAQKIIVESVESQNARVGCGCGILAIGLLVGIPAIMGTWLAQIIRSIRDPQKAMDPPFYGRWMAEIDQLIPWWGGLLLIFFGLFWFIGQSKS